MEGSSDRAPQEDPAQWTVTVGKRARLVAGALGLALVGCTAMAAAGGGGGWGGTVGRSELIYIDSLGESQHVQLSVVPPVAAVKAKAKEAAQKKDSYDDAPLLDALKDHERRDSALEHVRKMAHRKPRTQHMWKDNKWDKDMIHAMPSGSGTRLESAAQWYSDVVSGRSAAELAAKAPKPVLKQRPQRVDGESNVFGGL